LGYRSGHFIRRDRLNGNETMDNYRMVAEEARGIHAERRVHRGEKTTSYFEVFPSNTKKTREYGVCIALGRALYEGSRGEIKKRDYP